MNPSEILAFAQQDDLPYTDVEYLCEWRGYQVYDPLWENKNSAKVGLPYVILVCGETIRWSTEDETYAFIDEKGDELEALHEE